MRAKSRSIAIGRTILRPIQSAFKGVYSLVNLPQAESSYARIPQRSHRETRANRVEYVHNSVKSSKTAIQTNKFTEFCIPNEGPRPNMF